MGDEVGGDDVYGVNKSKEHLPPQTGWSEGLAGWSPELARNAS